MLAHAGRMASTPVENVVIGPRYRIDPAHFENKRLIFIANPNNPTGQTTPRSVVRKALDSGAFVFIDEAYFDFSGESVIGWIEHHDNLSIGRSLSKSMLAGLRMGFLIAHPVVIRSFESLVTSPYNLTLAHLVIAETYEHVIAAVNENARFIVNQRLLVQQKLEKMGLVVYPSETNFLLFELDDPGAIHRKLLASGIRVRDMSSIRGLGKHLRVTIGTEEQNEMFVNTMVRIV